MASKERRKRLRDLGLEMPVGLHGISLSWFEVTTANAALEQAVKKCPRGSFVSSSLERLHKRISKRAALNSAWIDKQETENEKSRRA